jgi:hypothetical protein
MRVPFAVCLSFFLASISCEVPKKTESGNAPAENWERMRQCADQTDKLATRFKWRSDESMGWGSHYNSERQRCFVVATTFQPGSATVFEELYDGFEGANLGSRMVQSAGNKDLICNVTAHPWTETPSRVDCSDYRKILTRPTGKIRGLRGDKPAARSGSGDCQRPPPEGGSKAAIGVLPDP